MMLRGWTLTKKPEDLFERPDFRERWHPYWKWEEVPYNMWGTVKDKKVALGEAIKFTGDAALYGDWMMKVADMWMHSCEHHLTKLDTNRKAWIGHAAAAAAIRCPEDIVREAWGHLTKQQQDDANAAAQRAIDHWDAKNAEILAGN